MEQCSDVTRAPHVLSSPVKVCSVVRPLIRLAYLRIREIIDNPQWGYFYDRTMEIDKTRIIIVKSLRKAKKSGKKDPL